MKDLFEVKKSLQPEFKKYLEEQKKKNPEDFVFIKSVIENYCELNATVKQQKEFLKKLNGKKGDDFMEHLLGQGYGMW
jgi:uncharacterized protein (DUF2147 family)